MRKRCGLRCFWSPNDRIDIFSVLSIGPEKPKPLPEPLTGLVYLSPGKWQWLRNKRIQLHREKATTHLLLQPVFTIPVKS
jgi:hypothetical protein